MCLCGLHLIKLGVKCKSTIPLSYKMKRAILHSTLRPAMYSPGSIPRSPEKKMPPSRSRSLMPSFASMHSCAPERQEAVNVNCSAVTSYQGTGADRRSTNCQCCGEGSRRGEGGDGRGYIGV